jgi:hypothetical protein
VALAPAKGDKNLTKLAEQLRAHYTRITESKQQLLA